MILPRHIEETRGNLYMTWHHRDGMKLGPTVFPVNELMLFWCGGIEKTEEAEEHARGLWAWKRKQRSDCV
ncbi:uncharacterized protein G2W53_005776 [Senna tora]|uniref:Uncharacterized protein n=1 Tax=Senna tora TaxID=362788 RepID=A0A834X3H8_9FABA|nr:uncharacterized protein G2W53_005776 [Senna tora]